MSSEVIFPPVLTSNNDKGFVVSASSILPPYTYRGHHPFTTLDNTNGWVTTYNTYSSNIPTAFNHAKTAWNKYNTSSTTTTLKSLELWPNAVSVNNIGSINESTIQKLVCPYGYVTDVWVSKNQDNTAMNTANAYLSADGGWDVSFNVSDTKNYISIVYVKRVSNSVTGNFYHGCHSSSTAPNTMSISDSTPAINPYFTNHGGGVKIGLLPLNEWCVSIGYIYASNSNVTTHNPNGGVYVITGPNAGTKLNTGLQRSYKIRSGATVQNHRSFLYYAEDIESSTNSTNIDASSILLWSPGFYEWNPSNTFNLNSILIPLSGGNRSNLYVGNKILKYKVGSGSEDRKGEYVTITLPKKMALSSVLIQSRNNDQHRGDPYTVYVYGKNDTDVLWNEIGYGTNLSYGKKVTNNIQISSSTTFYNSYAFLVTEIINFASNYLSINKINLRGVIEGSSSQVTIPDRTLHSFLQPITSNVQEYISNVPNGILPGVYTMTDSSHVNDSIYQPYLAFDTNINTSWITQWSRYNGTVGNASYGMYSPNTSTRARINNREGEYIVLDCPNRYVLTGFRVQNRNDAGSASPEIVHVFGSNDNTTWTEIGSETNLKTGANIMNPSTGWFNITTNNSYKIFALLVSKVTPKNTSTNLCINKIEYKGILDNIPINSTLPLTSTSTNSSFSKNLNDGNRQVEKSTSSTTGNGESSGLSMGAIIGISIAVVVFFIFIIIAVMYNKRKSSNT